MGSSTSRQHSSRAVWWTVILLVGMLVVGTMTMWWSARPDSQDLAGSLHAVGDATLGWIIDWRTPTQKHPITQFDFWDAEIRRILADHPDDAELHAAAARMMDQPCMHLYVSQCLREVSRNSTTQQFSIQLFDRMGQWQEQYEQAGAPRVCQWIEQAIQLEPEQAKWRRLHAVFVFPGPLHSSRSPRIDQWALVLDEARKHDPDNALYDILEANQRSSLALKLDSNVEFVAADPDAWNDTLRLVREAVQRTHLTLGEPGMEGLVRLHHLSKHPRAYTTESIRARLLSIRLTMPTVTLTRTLLRMHNAPGEIPATYSRQQILILAQQLSQLAAERSDKSTRYSNILFERQVMVAQAMLDSAVADQRDTAEAQAELHEAIRRKTAYKNAVAKVESEQTAVATPIGSFASSISLSLLSACLGFLLIVTAIGGVTRWRGHLGFSIWPFAMFAIGILLSFVFFGIGPSGRLSVGTQHWALTVLAFLWLASLLAGIAIRMRYRLQFSVRSLLLISTLSALLIQTAFQWQIGWDVIGLPLKIHADGDPLIQLAQSTGSSIGTEGTGLAWINESVLQWIAKQGPSWSLPLTAMLIFIALIWKKSFVDSIGELIFATTAMVLIFANIWVWIEPANHRANRLHPTRIETYIESVDRYYEPYENAFSSFSKNPRG